MGYITNFIVYTLAMVGVIVVALLVCKNATSIGQGKVSKYLKLIDSISLGQRKNLYIVSTGNEEFLIASDVNNTCLISKLESINKNSFSQKLVQNNFDEHKIDSFKETLENTPKQSYMDKSNIGIKSSLLNQKTSGSMMKNLAEKMKK